MSDAEFLAGYFTIYHRQAFTYDWNSIAAAYWRLRTAEDTISFWLGMQQ